jgi:dihydrodipicolinate reductase
MTQRQIAVCLAGATGWAGSELARGIARCADLTLAAAVSRTHAGRDLGEVLGQDGLTCPIYASATDALARPCDVFVEYTKPDQAKANVLAALDRGAHSAEVIFGMPDQRLSLRHDAGTSARPYVDGALLAIRSVSTLVGVHRGLDTVLD